MLLTDELQEETGLQGSLVELPPLLRLQQAKEENERLRRDQEFKEKNGIYFYRPHLKQHNFHKSTATGRYFRFGNRAGKSECGIVEDISLCLGQRVFYKKQFDIVNGERKVVGRHEGYEDHPLVRQGIPDHAVKGLIIVVDWDLSERIFFKRKGSYDTQGKFFKFCPHSAIDSYSVDGKGRIVEIRIKRLDGRGISTLTIETVHSFKNSKLSLESSDWDFIHVDEPCPEAMFTATSRGLIDRNGRYWFNCTPLDEMWINDHFTPPKKNYSYEAPNGEAFELETEDGHKVTRFCITGSIYDNPYRNDAGVAQFESTLTRDERACRIHGLPTAMAGLMYKEFQHDVHVLEKVPEGWEAFDRPPRDYTIRVWWDYHLRLPQALLFLATDPKGRVFVFDEFFDENMVGPNALRLVSKMKGYYVQDKEIDPYALIDNPVDGTNIQDELIKYDLWFEPATKDLTTGILKVRERLRERDPQGNPTIYFSPHLTQTLFEFNHYVYDGDKGTPKDEHNHMMENLYRAVLNGLAYVPPVIETSGTFKRKPTIVRMNEDQHGFKQPKVA